MGLVLTGCSSGHSELSSAEEEINKFNKSGKKQGPWEVYQDSVLIAKGNYDNGEPEGLWTYWYPNGMLKEEGNYKNGLKTSIWTEWYQDGELMWKGEYEDGKRVIGYPDEKIEVKFIGEVPEDNVLISSHTYKIQIRILNIPCSHLFVETRNGSIMQQNMCDLFTLETPSDTSLTLAIGYVQSSDFEDFRHLISEIVYKIH